MISGRRMDVNSGRIINNSSAVYKLVTYKVLTYRNTARMFRGDRSKLQSDLSFFLCQKLCFQI